MAAKAPLYDNDGNVIGIVGTSTNITAEREAVRLQLENQRLEAARLQLENQTYQAKQKTQARFLKFIENMEHEIQSYKTDTLYEETGITPPVINPHEQITLTHREEQTLYYLSLYRGPKEIASILSVVENKEISAATVQSVINHQLYKKFEVNSISQLIEKAKALKLISFTLNKV